MNLTFARHMVEACRKELGWEAHLLYPHGVPDSDEIPCAVLVQGASREAIEVELMASVVASHYATRAGVDDSLFPEGVEGNAVYDGVILI